MTMLDITECCLRCGKGLVLPPESAGDPTCPECGWSVLAARNWRRELDKKRELRLKLRLLKVSLCAAAGILLVISWAIWPDMIEGALSRGIAKGKGLACLLAPVAAATIGVFAANWWKARREGADHDEGAQEPAQPSTITTDVQTSLKPDSIRASPSVWRFARGAVVGAVAVWLYVALDMIESRIDLGDMYLGWILLASIAVGAISGLLAFPLAAVWNRFVAKHLPETVLQTLRRPLIWIVASVFVVVWLVRFAASNEYHAIDSVLQATWSASISATLVLAAAALWRVATDKRM
jgi:hypothetical protein